MNTNDIVVIYDRKDGTGPEVIGPFESEEAAADWVPEEWEGVFTIMQIIAPVFMPVKPFQVSEPPHKDEYDSVGDPYAESRGESKLPRLDLVEHIKEQIDRDAEAYANKHKVEACVDKIRDAVLDSELVPIDGFSVTKEQLADVLCSAFEGGIGYWAAVDSYHPVDFEGHAWEHPLLAHGWVKLRDKTGEGGFPGADVAKLDMEALKRGLRVLAKKYPKRLSEIMSGDEDAETGDVFVQCCVFGEVVFG